MLIRDTVIAATACAFIVPMLLGSSVAVASPTLFSAVGVAARIWSLTGQLSHPYQAARTSIAPYAYHRERIHVRRAARESIAVARNCQPVLALGITAVRERLVQMVLDFRA